MSEREYRTEFDKVMLLVRLAASADIDLDFIQRTLERAEAIGPLLLPTEYHWRRGGENLSEQRKILHTADPFIRASRLFVEQARALDPPREVPTQ